MGRRAEPWACSASSRGRWGTELAFSGGFGNIPRQDCHPAGRAQSWGSRWASQNPDIHSGLVGAVLLRIRAQFRMSFRGPAFWSCAPPEHGRILHGRPRPHGLNARAKFGRESRHLCESFTLFRYNFHQVTYATPPKVRFLLSHSALTQRQPTARQPSPR